MIKQSIILDIDETLVHTFSPDETEEFLKLEPFTNPLLFSIRNRVYNTILYDVGEPAGSGDRWNMYGIKRPYLNEFLTYCFKRFENVIIWSAGKKEYVDHLAGVMTDFLDEDAKFVLNFDHVRHGEEDYDKPIDFIKEFYQDIKNVNLNNTFIVDDKSSNFHVPNPFNGILIPAYNPTLTINGLLQKDTMLLKLMDFFKQPHVCSTSDIRKIDKQRIFA